MNILIGMDRGEKQNTASRSPCQPNDTTPWTDKQKRIRMPTAIWRIKGNVKKQRKAAFTRDEYSFAKLKTHHLSLGLSRFNGQVAKPPA